MNNKELITAEEPLVGLCPKPLDQMSESELREWVIEQRQLCNSAQSLRAEFARKRIAKAEKETTAEVKSAMFDDL